MAKITPTGKSLAQGKGVTGVSKTALAKVEPTSQALAARPDFLVDQPIVGTEALGRFVQLPLFKIVQPQSTKMLEKFSAGDVVFLATGDVLADAIVDAKGKFQAGTPFHFVPLMFYVEYCAWNDIDKKDAPAIFARSFDENSEIALKAKDSERREERDPEDEDLTITYSEHLNFVVQIYDHGNPLDGQVGVFSFSRGNHKDGRQLAKLIKMRAASPFECVFKACAADRRRDDYKWFGLDISNPDPDSGVSPWIADAETRELFAQKHEELKSLVKTDRLRTDPDDDARRPAKNMGDEGDDV